MLYNHIHAKSCLIRKKCAKVLMSHKSLRTYGSHFNSMNWTSSSININSKTNMNIVYVKHKENESQAAPAVHFSFNIIAINSSKL